MKIYILDIGMEFDIEKWATLIMKSGKRRITEGIQLSNQERLRTFGGNENYKYLGILELPSGEDKNKNKKFIKHAKYFLKPSSAAELSSKGKAARRFHF